MFSGTIRSDLSSVLITVHVSTGQVTFYYIARYQNMWPCLTGHSVKDKMYALKIKEQFPDPGVTVHISFSNVNSYSASLTLN